MVNPHQFRQVMGKFLAGVTAVTVSGSPPIGITVNAFSSVSLDPALVLICLDHDTNAHERLASGADGYCVNILAHDQQHLGEHFAGIDELEETPFETEPTRTETTGAHIFEESIAYLDCSLHEIVPSGDHTIYIGQVEQTSILRPNAAVLTYYSGEWGTYPSEN